MRIYDPRIGKFLSVDPIAKQYPFYSPYHFAGNRPIVSVDIDGLEPSPFGYMASYSGYDPNTSNQTGVAKQFVSDFKETMKNPETYKAAALGTGQMAVGMLAGIFTEGVGISLFARNFKMPAVSTSVEAPIIESSIAEGEAVLWRGDARAPAEIFEQGGFYSKGDNMNLFEHAKSNPANSGYVSASTNEGVAMESAEMNQGYVYKIKNTSSLQGKNVNQTLGSRSPNPHEAEIAIPNKIPSENILGAQKVGSDGKYTGEYIQNFDFTTGGKKQT